MRSIFLLAVLPVLLFSTACNDDDDTNVLSVQNCDVESVLGSVPEDAEGGLIEDSALPAVTATAELPEDLVTLRDKLIEAGADFGEHIPFRIDYSNPDVEGMGYYHPEQSDCPVLNGRPYLVYFTSPGEPWARGFWIVETEDGYIVRDWTVKDGVCTERELALDDITLNEAFTVLTNNQECSAMLLTAEDECSICKKLFETDKHLGSVDLDLLCAILTSESGVGPIICTGLIAAVEIGTLWWDDAEAFCKYFGACH